MFGYVGLFVGDLVAISWFFPPEKRGQVIAFLIKGIGFVSQWTLIGCGLYFLLWVALH